MSYTTPVFYAALIVLFVLYYIFPIRHRWILLLLGSMAFYYRLCSRPLMMAVFLVTITVSYLLSLAKKSRVTPALGIALVLTVFFAAKLTEVLPSFSSIRENYLVIPGLSFYSLSVIAYLADVHKGRIEPQRNILKYALYVSFFPHVIQGPIPSYRQLSARLFEGHRFDERNMMRGINLILYGFFLKLMIADKAGVVVGAIRQNPGAYRGFYILAAVFLYTIQLYADFSSCVTISRGISRLFGIELMDNFHQPYLSLSVKEMWQRWHISLGQWLRDYIYIPLGGSKRGRLRKYINLFVTFLVSGIWHGLSLKYMVWGMLQGALQIFEELSGGFKARKNELFFFERSLKRAYVFAMMMLSMFFFSAASLSSAIGDILSLARDANPWIFFDGSVFRLGLNELEVAVLFLSIAVMGFVDVMKERGVKIQEWFFSRSRGIRWLIYLLIIWSMWILGTYGYGFDSSAFIYGGF